MELINISKNPTLVGGNFATSAEDVANIVHNIVSLANKKIKTMKVEIAIPNEIRGFKLVELNDGINVPMKDLMKAAYKAATSEEKKVLLSHFNDDAALIIFNDANIELIQDEKTARYSVKSVELSEEGKIELMNL